MITILFHVTVKEGREAEFRSLADGLEHSTHVEDTGCLAYTYFRRTGDPRRLVLFEQWHDAEALNAHLARLQRTLGPADDEASLPASHPRRRLPRAFMDLLDEAEAVRYEPLMN